MRTWNVLIAAWLASLPVHAEEAGGDVARWCGQLGVRLRSVVSESCRRLDFVPAPTATIGGNRLMRTDVMPATGADDRENAWRILVIGGIHGDELTSISTVFRWLEWMRLPAATPYYWRVIPLANPDGMLARPSTRTNGNAVDLNRNFETPDWGENAVSYWVRRTQRDPRRHPGKQAGSEIETRWLQEQIADFRPDLIVSLHAPYNLLDYDGPVPQPLRFGRLALNRLGVYPGSLGNYAGVARNIPVITIELPHATVMPPLRDQQAIWEDMLGWLKANLPLLAKREARKSGNPQRMPAG